MRKRLDLRKIVKWHKSQIDEEKARVKAELDEIYQEKGKDARLSHALKSVQKLQHDESEASQLKRFIYAVSALVHHVTHRGLSSTQIKGLANLGHALLHANGIQTIASKLGFLHAEVHFVLSQIYRKEGEHWKSAWEQQFSYHVSRKAPLGGASFQAYSKGLRAARLGFTEVALNELLTSEQEDDSDQKYEMARLGRIKILRLSGDLEASEALIEDTDIVRFSELGKRELEWERLCRQVQRTEDLTEMLKAVEKGGACYEGVFLMEAFLWTKAVSCKQWTERLPKVRYLIRNKELKLMDTGYFYICCREIEKSYDSDIPLLIKLRTLGEVLDSLHKLLSIDRELLALAAITRTLARNKAFSLASLAINQYRGKSLLLSSGKSEDVLGIMRNLLEKPWAKAGNSPNPDDDGDLEEAS